jgi:signal transduction histidine kinase
MEGEELQKIGLNKATFEGKLIREMGHFSSQWKKNMVAYAQKTFEGKNFSYEISHKDYIYRVNTMPLHDEQQINLVLFVYTNITEQKHTEMEMFKALKKERELGELKSRFVSMASHEFRTPLSTILSAANLIARQNEVGNENERLKNVERIRSSVKNLVDILNEFLSLGRLEEGKVSINNEVFDLVEFMKTIVQELQHAQKPGQEVHISSPQQLMQVNLDKQFVRNIFLNLLSNALKYSPEGKPVDIVLTTQPGAICVKVMDQGVGIPEDEHKHLFDLFFRARNATNIQGTGLGLPIVKKYIDLMQGDITVESQLDKGTTFTITLPLEQINQA